MDGRQTDVDGDDATASNAWTEAKRNDRTTPPLLPTAGATGDASSEEETAGRRTRCTAQRIGSSSEKTNGKTIGDRQMQRNRLDLES